MRAAEQLVEDDLKAFSFTHVVYRQGDLLGKLMALLSLSPIFIMVSFATLIASRRDLRTVSFVAGQLLNEALNSVLKHTIKQPRPVALVRYHLGSYGMPSDHAQFMFFAAAYVVMFAALRWGQPAWARVAWSLLTVAFASAVCVSRVYLMYHTAEQILVGAIIGAGAGVMWFLATEAWLRPWFPAIASHPVARFFLIRDCSACSDVLQAEYDATAGTSTATAAAARKRGAGARGKTSPGADGGGSTESGGVGLVRRREGWSQRDGDAVDC